MTKTKIDYSKCAIYKLCCRDPEITDIYVGSTTNLVSRKHKHKSDCSNINTTNHNSYVYRYIREHGGWENWDLVIIETPQCKNSVELHTRERYYIDLMKATLNVKIPTRTHAEFARKYRAMHKDKLKQYGRQQRILNKERLTHYRRQYYLNNKDKIQEHRTIQTQCAVCDIAMLRVNISKHVKTKKHIKKLEPLKNE